MDVQGVGLRIDRQRVDRLEHLVHGQGGGIGAEGGHGEGAAAGREEDRSDHRGQLAGMLLQHARRAGHELLPGRDPSFLQFTVLVPAE